MLYEKTGTFKTRFSSAIHSDDFFNHPDGRVDAEAELFATLKAFWAGVGDDENNHAQCKFKGRYVWLNQQLDFKNFSLPEIRCPAYEDWSLNGTTESISIVFATGYLGNPASYYGHTLLKMNSNNSNDLTDLEDVTVNYGAIVPPDEGAIPYVFKGLFGFYEAGFSHIQYYYHNHNYGENELRDLWEYELDLNEGELQLVLGHTWEVLSKKYTYFFTRRNCAYRMAEILEVIDGLDIIPQKRPWTVPQALIQKAANAELNGKPLIKAVHYHPSRQSRLYKRFSLLNAEQKVAVRKAVSDIEFIESAEFKAQSITNQQLILDVLLDYYQFVRETDLLEKDPNNIYYRRVLAKRYQLPPGKSDITVSANDSPHNGRKPSLFSIGAAYNSQFGSGANLQFRPVYYDSLDTDFGHVKNASLSMGRLELSVFDDRVFVKNLDVVSIESVNSAVTGLPGDTGQSWKLRLGLERQSLACDGCLVGFFQADIGQTHSIADGVLLGGYLGGSLQEDKNDFGSAYARASGFINADINGNFRLRLASEYREYVDSGPKGNFVTILQGRYRLSTNLDLRFSYERNIAEEANISLAWYW